MKNLRREEFFTADNIIKMISMNDTLKNGEKRIRAVAENLQISLEKQKKEKVIDGYNFQTTLKLFSHFKSCNNRHGVETAIPFYEDKNYLMFRLKQDESFYKDDWDCGMGIIPKEDGMCYTMHCICKYSDLEWQDYLDINYFQIELKVDYQFFVEMPIKNEIQNEGVDGIFNKVNNKKKLSKEEFLSGANLIRVKSLNEKLKKEEKRIRTFAESLRILLDKQVEEKVFLDYTIKTKILLFSHNKACNKRHSVEDGDSFYEDKCYTMFEDLTDEKFYTDDWDCGMGIIPKDEGMCYTMHRICKHSDLEWQDILDIEDVWFELKVDYQFWVIMPMHRWSVRGGDLVYKGLFIKKIK